MIGRRLSDGFHYRDSKPGDYWRQSHGTVDDPGDYARRNIDFSWCIRDPNGSLGSLRSHTVTEHEDGTITVSPSILDPSPGGWHGFLGRGEWRSV